MDKDTNKKVSVKKSIRDSIIIIITFIIILFLVESLIMQPVKMKQESMFPTIKQNEIWLIDKWSKTIGEEIKKGDIIMFESPLEKYISDENGIIAKYDEKSSENLIKRVIATEGEHIQIKDNRVYVNDKKIEEEYLYKQYSTEDSGRYPYYFLDLVVPEDCIFVMGDNRRDSVDSRSFGCIPIDKVKGKLGNKIYPINEEYTREDLVEILDEIGHKENFKMEIKIQDTTSGENSGRITIWSKNNVSKIKNIENDLIWHNRDSMISLKEQTRYKNIIEENLDVLFYWKISIQDNFNLVETDYIFKYLNEEKYNNKNSIVFELNWCNEEDEPYFNKIKMWVDKDVGEILKIELYEENKSPAYIVEYELQTDIVTNEDVKMPDTSNYEVID